MENRTLDINGKSKWEVNKMLDEPSDKIPNDNGYFGAYTRITYKRKQAIVLVDDRDAVVEVITGWYDMIMYGRDFGYYAIWSGDYRWNTDKPIIVCDNGKYNLNAPHTDKLLMNEWVKELRPVWRNSKLFGDYLVGINDKDKEIYVTPKGSIKLAEIHNEKSCKEQLKWAKSLPVDKIQEQWIDKGLPCAYMRGLEYKGSRPGLVTIEEATDLFRTHHRFDGSFYSAEWRVFDGEVTLLFRDYADSDYD